MGVLALKHRNPPKRVISKMGGAGPSKMGRCVLSFSWFPFQTRPVVSPWVRDHPSAAFAATPGSLLSVQEERSGPMPELAFGTSGGVSDGLGFWLQGTEDRTPNLFW